MTGNYLKAFDAVMDLPSEERGKTLREMAASQPELLKYKNLLGKVSDEALLAAFRRSEVLGAEMLTEEDGR